MSQFVLPWVDEGEYAAFRKLLNELPGNYQSWLATHRQTVAFAQARGGIRVINVSVRGFIAYLVTIDAAPSGVELWRYTQMRAMAYPELSSSREARVTAPD